VGKAALKVPGTKVPGAAFVTGGSGFIGGALVRRLVGEGTAVRALARSDASAEKVAALGAEPVRGDLDDPASMAAGAAGCDVTFHLAAHLAAWGPREDFVRGNVTGTENALEASRRAGVRRFVHCGTEAVLLVGEELVDADETMPLRPDSKVLYSATKAEAEQRVRDASADGFDAVVLRPRLVWGAGDTTLLPEFVEAAESGKLMWIAGGSHLTDTTHVENVVEGLVLAAAKGRTGEAYFVTDGEPVEFRAFVSALLETQGVEAPTRSIPDWLGRALAAGSEVAWRVLPLRGEPPIHRLAYWLSAKQCTIDISKASTELGYEPVIDRERGMAELRDAS
jgi:nucleoside-diphosphate-sugar epimerase